MIPYTPPQFNKTSFNCPHCQTFSEQRWIGAYAGWQGEDMQSIKFSFCEHCGKYSIWHHGKMIYPEFTGIEPPNPDLLEEIKEDYMEAAEIVQKSPRGAAALLRLVIQKLCIQLGGKGENLNTDIGDLVKNGLPSRIQQSLDALRVIGNEAVHPGQLDLKDDIETASALFKLVNFIAEKMITEPKYVEEIYVSKVPEEKKKQIKERDGR